jgi:uncharacterized protein YyaL (SSP411 family)
VDWYPWGEEALARARDEGRPIFLSVGYAACHWCHVMERESFEDAEVAAFLNDHFVAIKVDREERPDIDAVYMTAVQALTGSGGWPLTVFLTPGLEPFYGGTYFPPESRWGRPSFLELLHAVAQAWAERRDEVVRQAAQLADHLNALSSRPGPGHVDLDRATRTALSHLSANHDPRWGGFGGAPKFPTPSRLFFLLHHAAGGDAQARAMLATTLDGMAAGGMVDWVGGGFHRYSVDETWLIPHFEKMLVDNALLARAYGEAALRLGEPRWVEVARATADYLVREMQGPEGGFFSSTDADSEGREGLYFTWTAAEVRTSLPAEEADAVVGLCALDDQPNFEDGRSALRPRLPIAELAVTLGCDADEAAARVDRGRRGLYQARRLRVPPLTDDKRLAGWNGMAVWALAWLGAAVEEPRYLEAARRCGEFVVAELLRADGSLTRSWRDGARAGAETLEDVAWVAAGLVELYQADGSVRWLEAALRLVDARLPCYRDGGGALFDAPDDGERLPMRPRDAMDGAAAASPAVLAGALFRLAALTDRGDLAEAARQAVAAESGLLERAPEACTSLLVAAVELTEPPRELVVVGEPGWPSTRGLLRAARRSSRPPTVIAPAPAVPVPAAAVASVPLFAGREHAEQGRALAYLCEGGGCRLPVDDPDALARALAADG